MNKTVETGGILRNKNSGYLWFERAAGTFAGVFDKISMKNFVYKLTQQVTIVQ